MLNFDVKAKIKKVRDILVGKVPDPKAQVEQITIALIYKFMDDMDLESMELGAKREFFKDEYEKYAWSNIMQSQNSGQQRFDLYYEGIYKISTNPHLPQLFRDIFKDATVPYRDVETLNKFLKEINDFNYDHSEELGNAFEYLLSIMGSQGDAGQFRTPRHIIDMIVAIVDPKKNDTVLDPACGTAGFLISSYKHILENNKDDEGNSKLSADDRNRMTENFAGYDISPDMVRLSRVNMYLHKFVKPKIYEYDTLSSIERWNENYDVILANPPFMTPKGGIIPHNRFRVKAKRSEVLFVDYIAEHLSPSGRAGIIVPEGIVFQTANAYKELRKYLMEDGLLYAVISLPSGVFNPYAGVKTSILLFDKSFAKEKNEILFVKIKNDGYDLGAQRRDVIGSDIPEVINIINGYLKGEDVSNNELVTIASKKDIAEQDYILVGERYKEIVVHDSNYPLVELGEICSIERGTSITSKDLKEGEIPVIAGGQQPAYYHNIYNRIGNTITISGSGAYAGYINYFEEPIFASDCSTIKSNDPNVNIKYIYFVIKSQQEKFYKLQSGMGQPHVYVRDIKPFRIPFPPLHIQEEIVKEIESYQKIIDGAKQVVENYKPTIMNNPTWEVLKLGDICELNPKKSEIKELPNTTEVSFVPMADVNEHEIHFSPKDIKSLSEVYSGYTYFRENDVLLAKVTPCFENGKAGIARNLENGIGFGSSELYVLRALKDKVLPEIIYYTISSFAFLIKGKNNMTGTGGLQRLTKDYVLNYPISLPDISTQNQLVEKINEEIIIIEKNKLLIELFDKKIKNKINEVWGVN